jgi:hypothetical protein
MTWIGSHLSRLDGLLFHRDTYVHESNAVRRTIKHFYVNWLFSLLTVFHIAVRESYGLAASFKICNLVVQYY